MVAHLLISSSCRGLVGDESTDFNIFSSPEQSSRRAIVLPPASALVLALALALPTTNVRVLR